MTDAEFKKLLWDSANKLRGAMSAAEYKLAPGQIEWVDPVPMGPGKGCMGRCMDIVNRRRHYTL